MGGVLSEFGPNDVVVVGGDYGQVVIEGLTPQARTALDQVVGASRRSGDRVGILTLVTKHDDTPDIFENRHAGCEGTRQVEGPNGIERGSEDAEGSIAHGTGFGPD